MKIQVYLNEGADHFFGFHNMFADQPALRQVLAFDVPDTMAARLHDGKPLALLEHVFEQLNIGGDLVPAEPWTRQYRADRNRSLSVGDVVIVGETAYSVESTGWERVPTDDLLDAINRFASV